MSQYFDLETAGLQREERQRRLRGWGFTCFCDICSLTGEELENNEKLRENLRVLKGKLAECETDIRNIISLVEQEGLEREILQLLRDLQSQLSGERESDKTVITKLTVLFDSGDSGSSDVASSCFQASDGTQNENKLRCCSAEK